jgi:sugar porter (SP) family MFS transporter
MKFNLKYVLGISLVSALGGFLFGYDWVVIGGAKPFYERFFDIVQNPALQGFAMSSALVGCVFGAGFTAWISGRAGRRGALMMAAVLFIISATGSGAAQTIGFFMAFRIVGGIGIGIASTISPVYIAEVSPARYRGRLVALNQLNIVVGILAAQVINYLIAQEVPAGATDRFILESWNGQTGWRWMFWAENGAATLFFLLLFFIPESPRYMAGKEKWEQASRVLQRIGGNAYAESEMRAIKGSFSGSGEKVGWTGLFRKKYRVLLLIGVTLAVFQQWCGINVVFNYAEEVFSAAGYEVTAMLLNVVITGIVNLAFTFVAIRTVDRWGRKKLMMTGSLGLCVLYLALGLAYFLDIRGIPILLIVLACIAVYAMTLAPVTWVILSEIFPNRIRGQAVALATTALWVASSVLVLTFPFLNRGLDAHGTFWLYSGICLAGFLFIARYLSETRGKSLEQIEQEFVF